MKSKVQYNKEMRYVYVFLGFIFVAIGVVGIYLPLLPTTPFLLLAAMCFHRGSPRFHNWLMEHKYLGPPIRDWNQNQIIRVKYKVLACTMMGVTSTVVFLKPNIPLIGKAAYSVVVFSVVTFILTRKSK